MRFNYAGRAQSAGRVACERCKNPMLGIGEQDPRSWTPETWLDKSFCDCPDDTKPESASEPREWTLWHPDGENWSWAAESRKPIGLPNEVEVIEKSAYDRQEKTISELRAALKQIDDLDNDPYLHNIKDPTKCALCIARETLARTEVK